MTTHLAPLPPPREPHISSHPDVTVNLMTFYTEAIKLYDILDRILADVYNSCRGRPTQHESMSTTTRPGGLDTILDIGMQLTMFESNLPSFLKWSADASAVYADGVPNAALAQQRHVLHARCVASIIFHQLRFLFVCIDTSISTFSSTALSSHSSTRKMYEPEGKKPGQNCKRTQYSLSLRTIHYTPPWPANALPPA